MKISLIGAASLLLLASVPASAGSLVQARQIVIHYEDINVKQPIGAQELLARIDAASREVCGPAPDMRQLGPWQAYKSCVQTAMDRAVSSLPFDLMAALQGNLRQAVAQR